MSDAKSYLVKGNRGLISICVYFFWLFATGSLGFSFVLSVLTCFIVFKEFYSFEDGSWKYYLGISIGYVFFNVFIMLYGYFAFVIQKIRDYFS